MRPALQQRQPGERHLPGVGSTNDLLTGTGSSEPRLGTKQREELPPHPNRIPEAAWWLGLGDGGESTGDRFVPVLVVAPQCHLGPGIGAVEVDREREVGPLDRFEQQRLTAEIGMAGVECLRRRTAHGGPGLAVPIDDLRDLQER